MSSCRSLGGSESTGECACKRNEHQGDTRGFRSGQPEGRSSRSLREEKRRGEDPGGQGRKGFKRRM